jgi:hypothetical protein
MEATEGARITNADWLWRAEMADLLWACRARVALPAVPGTRGGGLRQEDVAHLAGMSLRRYAAFERGEFTPPAGMVDLVAAALRMPSATRCMSWRPARTRHARSPGPRRARRASRARPCVAWSATWTRIPPP